MTPEALRKRKSRSTSISSSDNVNGLNKNKNEDIKYDKLKEIPFYGIKTCHSERKSLFSSTSGYDDYRGFLNLCVVLLVVSNARAFLENILKYGILVDPVQWVTTVLDNPYEWPNLLLMLGSNFFILFAFHIERLLARNYISENAGVFLHFVNLLFVIVLPPIRILSLDHDPIGSLCSCMLYVTVFLKLWSYAQANKWYRHDYAKALGKRRIHRTMSMPSAAFKEVKEENDCVQIKYPYNLSYRNLYYFMFAPTLCYEPNYPKMPSINKVYLGRRIVEILFLSQLELALIQQWIIPVLKNAVLPIHKSEGYVVAERLLKLSIPNHLIWLIFFYLFFHSVLNAVAEIMRFADREFYRDWWNAETIVYFWQAWNIPVHKFCVRHVYKPLLSSGVGKRNAQILVFFLSAFFHEYLVSIPLHMFKLWAFAGMALQIPLSLITASITKKVSGHYGNMIVWISIILGQPVAILAYVYYYYVENYSVSL